MIELKFERLRLDGDALATDWDLLLRIVADFSIVLHAAPIPLYREDEFCVVEFAMQITRWLGAIQSGPAEFSYDSVESDEKGLVSIRQEQDGWRVTALNQDYVEQRPIPIEDIQTAINGFVSTLTKQVQAKFGRDISHLVSGRPISL